MRERSFLVSGVTCMSVPKMCRDGARACAMRRITFVTLDGIVSCGGEGMRSRKGWEGCGPLGRQWGAVEEVTGYGLGGFEGIHVRALRVLLGLSPVRKAWRSSLLLACIRRR